MKKINICHISDLHFGIFENNSFSEKGTSFRLPESFIEHISQMSDNEKPHFLVVSGDLTSISKKNEYEQFLDFFDLFIKEDCFAKCNFQKYSEKDRTIIIPGNHDVLRKKKSGDDFANDSLASFKRNIVSKGFNTPLGNKERYCYTEKEKQFGKKRYACPIPCSFYFYPEYNIAFATIISCYYSHKIDPDIRKLQQAIEKAGFDKKIIAELEDQIEKNIYQDFGSFTQNYLRVIRRAFKNFTAKMEIKNDTYNNIIKFAVTHHHLKDLPFPQVNTENARETLELLFENGVISILHGHLHDVLDEYLLPKEWKDISSFFSGGTVSGYCRNTLNSFNMIEVFNSHNIKNLDIKIKCYEVNRKGYFKRVRSIYEDNLNGFLTSLQEYLN